MFRRLKFQACSSGNPKPVLGGVGFVVFRGDSKSAGMHDGPALRRHGHVVARLQWACLSGWFGLGVDARKAAALR